MLKFISYFVMVIPAIPVAMALAHYEYGILVIVQLHCIAVLYSSP